MPILLRGVAIALDVTHQLGINLNASIETKRRLYPTIFEVAVYRFGAAHYTERVVYASAVLGKQGSIGIGVVPTDNHKSIQSQAMSMEKYLLKLLLSLKFCTVRTNHIEASRIAVTVNNVCRKLPSFASE